MPGDREVADALTRVLVRACRALAEAGQPQTAGRLAADGWVAVRPTHTRQAQHLDGVMHHIARLEQQREHPPVRPPALAGGPARKETAVPTEDPVLDVRTEEPRGRHELIFEAFTDLPVGQAYVLVNDHDPKPLRYQFEAENVGEFSWQYLEEGPQVWRVRIGRTAAPGSAGAVSEVNSPRSGTPAARTATLWPDWRTVVAPRGTGPGVAVLHESADLKVVLVALAAGQGLPAHPGPAASFHILSGTGSVVIDEVEHPVSAGATVVAAPGTHRAVRAASPLVFLGNLGDPASEEGPH